MRKQAKPQKPGTKKSKPTHQVTPSEGIDTGRRGFIGSMRNSAIGLAIVGGPGAESDMGSPEPVKLL